MSELLEVIKENVKHHRNIQNLSQKELADKANISTTYIGEIETCRKFPSLKTLVKIAYALNIEPYVLLVSQNDDPNQIIIRYNKKLKENINNLIDSMENFK